MKMFILGLDGASYDLINHFVKKNKMPNFKKVIEKGKFTKLISTIPPHTAPGWVSAFTGVGPGKHGIYQFWDTQAKNYVGNFMSRDQYGALPVWDILNQYNFKTGMINIPMTHPPKEVNGFMMTWPLSNTLKYSYPKELLYEIAQHDGHYASDLNLMYTGDDAYIEEAIKVTHKRLKAIQYLIENKEWDFLASVFTEIDRISHYYWHYMDPNSLEAINTENLSLKNAIENIYIETDKALGKFLEILPEDTIFMVMSDHGFNRGEFDFYLQSFLLEHSLLSLKSAKELTEQEIDHLKNSWFECKKDGEIFYVDWSKTVAYMACPGSYGININLKGRQVNGIVEFDQYEQTRSQLIEVFRLIINPQTGRPLFEKVVRREEVYYGKDLEKAPDIMLIPFQYNVMVHHSIVPGTLFGGPEQKGLHAREGILGIYGKCIEEKMISDEIYLEDITPTILNYFGIEIPDYMDGKSICDFENKQLATCKGNYETQESKIEEMEVYSKEEKREAEEKLKSLGYL